jgi:hypothetical protein
MSVGYAALPRLLFVNGKIMALLTDQIEGTKTLESTAKALKNLRLHVASQFLSTVLTIHPFGPLLLKSHQENFAGNGPSAHEHHPDHRRQWVPWHGDRSRYNKVSARKASLGPHSTRPDRCSNDPNIINPLIHGRLI